ncbi:hypothetical protein COOONC_05509 [Cooperia oncophora]
MAYFRSFFGGGGAEAEEEDGAEIVEKMVERAETCTALEDRRDALRALRGMAKKLRLAVGTMGLNVYMDVLEKERSNQELLAITLEILVAVLSSDDESTDDDELGERLAEVMLKKPVFIPSLLAAVDDYDITVRRCVFIFVSLHCGRSKFSFRLSCRNFRTLDYVRAFYWAGKSFPFSCCQCKQWQLVLIVPHSMW